MPNFPLYDNIVQKLAEQNIIITAPISLENKTRFVDFIKVSNQNVHDFIYMLIKVYQLKFDTTSSTNLPFNGKEQKCGLKFDIDNIPTHLQHILFEFYNMQDTD
jgi:hypothetical protein